MASNAFSGVGTKLYREDPTSGWQVFAEVNSIEGPGFTRDTIDVTSLDSTGGYREFITGFRDGGEVTFELNFTNANADKLKTDFDSDSTRNYKIVLSDDDESIFSFSGYVTDMPASIPPDDKVTMNATIKITGETEFYAGSTTTTTTT
jgi:predicted secreted protein